MDIICICSQKGGIAKSTTAAAIAQAAAYRGRRALGIDLDPQGNLTFCLNGTTGGGSSYDLLTGGTPAGDLIQQTPQGLDLIPASKDLATITSGKGTARRLQRALEGLQGRYDVIAIDTPTLAGELQFNALQAATRLVIPLEADSLNMQSLYETLDTAQLFQKTNKALEITGAVITKFDARTLHARQMRDAIREQVEAMGLPYLGEIRLAIAIKEAQSFQKSLYEYAPKSKPAADYMALYEKVTHE